MGADQSCGKTSFGEGGRLVGSVAGGAFGGVGAAYLTCNVLFGIQTVGTSLLWCGIVAGVVGSYAGGKYGGQFTKEKGEVLYETIYQ